LFVCTYYNMCWNERINWKEIEILCLICNGKISYALNHEHCNFVRNYGIFVQHWSIIDEGMLKKLNVVISKRIREKKLINYYSVMFNDVIRYVEKKYLLFEWWENKWKYFVACQKQKIEKLDSFITQLLVEFRAWKWKKLK
jgi:hypothetical protein